MKKGLGRGLGLGKGLDALITYNETPEGAGQEILEMDVENIKPNQNQPRKYFKTPEIAELSESIKEFGIIQPLIVQKQDDGQSYIIVAGERRWRAAQEAGLAKVPVIVRDYSDFEVLGIALIENIQREDLNPIEEANCYKRLNEEFDMTQEEIAKKIGKSRSHISNCIRVLKLDERVLELISSEKLSMGHAKALLTIENKEEQFYIARKMVDTGMNVRAAEEFVRKYNAELPEVQKPTEAAPKEAHAKYQVDLRGYLGTRVNIKDNKTGGGGKIEINYFSQQDLERIVNILKT